MDLIKEKINSLQLYEVKAYVRKAQNGTWLFICYLVCYLVCYLL